MLFLLDSDFVAYPHRYVNNTNKELFEKIQKNTNQLMEAIESEDSFDVKSHIVSLFEENEKLDLIPKTLIKWCLLAVNFGKNIIQLLQIIKNQLTCLNLI